MLLQKTFDKINNTLFKRVDSTGLAIFRICFSTVLVLQVLLFFRFRHMIFDRYPFDYVGELDSNLILGFWLITTICLVLGLFTKTASIVNYVLAVIVFSSNRQWEVHVFYSYVGVSFLMMFMPMGKRLSLDNLVERWRNSNNSLYEPNYQVPVVSYYATLLFGIGFMYFDSVLFKLTTHMWLNGIGMWMPATIPAATWNDTSFILNQKELVIFLNYFVMVFEFFFIFLMWWKPFRLPYFILGFIFHVGIGITYPIPLFASAYASMYLLMVPFGVWSRLGNFLNRFWKFNTPTFVPGDKRSLNKAILFDHFFGPRRFSNQKETSPIFILPTISGERLFRIQWYFILIVFILIQLVVSWFSPYPVVSRQLHTNRYVNYVTKMVLEPVYRRVGVFSVKFFGITHHGVFVDHHFQGFNHLFRAEFVDKFGKRHHVPVLDKNGLVDNLVMEQTWRNIAFETITQNVRQEVFEPNFRLFLLQYFYEYKPNGAHDDRQGTFILYGKKIKVAREWEKDMLKKNMESPWFPVGTCSFEGTKLNYQWNQNMLDILDAEKKDPYRQPEM